MTKLNTFAGIDVSRDFFDVHVIHRQSNQVRTRRFANDAAGFSQLQQWLDAPAHCTMEVTGPYYLALAVHLHQNGFAVSVVNPLVIKHYAKMKLCRTKTDRGDAALLARYTLEQHPVLWTPPEAHLTILQQLLALEAQLIKHHSALLNQREAFRHCPLLDAAVEQLVEQSLSAAEHQLQAVRSRMQQTVAAHYAALLENLSTIPGLGPKTLLVLIVLTGGFSRFASAKALCSYVGLSPRLYDSGKTKGYAPISKMGMGRVRALLYVCAWSAVRCNRTCKELYQRLLAKGKAKKVALIAVANKLLKQAFAIAVSGTPYQQEYKKNICL